MLELKRVFLVYYGNSNNFVVGCHLYYKTFFFKGKKNNLQS